MLISQDSAELTAANAIQTRCELKNVALVRCTTGAYGQETEFLGPFRLGITHDSEAYLDGSALVVTASFKFDGHDTAEAPKLVFHIECAFCLRYSLKDDYKPAENEINAFKSGNAVFNSWPYVREFVQSMTARMGFTPPPLPLLRIKPKAATPKAQPNAAENEVKV